MTFRVGQKVVCIDDTAPAHIPGPVVLVKSHIYTVRSVGLTHPRDPDKLPCIEVNEIQGGCFWSRRFRPAVERKTDISIFTKMLKPQGVDA